jgi:hydrogenase maturation protease
MLSDAGRSLGSPGAPLPGAPLLVVGLGNLLMRDEGVGVHVVHRLRDAYRWGADVTLLDGGTAGIALLDDVSRADTLWCIDAAKLDASAGEMRWLASEQLDTSLGSGVSMHQLNIADVLGYLELMGASPRQVEVLAIVPERIEPGLALSSRLEQACDRAAAAVAARARAAGFEVEGSRQAS